jgi:hypothetical protein
MDGLRINGPNAFLARLAGGFLVGLPGYSEVSSGLLSTFFNKIFLIIYSFNKINNQETILSQDCVLKNDDLQYLPGRSQKKISPYAVRALEMRRRLQWEKIDVLAIT